MKTYHDNVSYKNKKLISYHKNDEMSKQNWYRIIKMMWCQLKIISHHKNDNMSFFILTCHHFYDVMLFFYWHIIIFWTFWLQQIPFNLLFFQNRALFPKIINTTLLKSLITIRRLCKYIYSSNISVNSTPPSPSSSTPNFNVLLTLFPPPQSIPDLTRIASHSGT